MKKVTNSTSEKSNSNKKESIFDQAIQYTFNEDMKNILLDCKNGIYPYQFKINKGKIISFRGNIYDMPIKPSDLCNIIYKIVNNIEPRKISTTPSQIVRSDMSVLEDALYDYSRRESVKYGLDENHSTLLFSCIMTAMFLEVIVPSNIIIKDGVVVSVPSIDTFLPKIII